MRSNARCVRTGMNPLRPFLRSQATRSGHLENRCTRKGTGGSNPSRCVPPQIGQACEVAANDVRQFEHLTRWSVLLGTSRTECSMRFFPLSFIEYISSSALAIISSAVGRGSLNVTAPILNVTRQPSFIASVRAVWSLSKTKRTFFEPVSDRSRANSSPASRATKSTSRSVL